jgi:LacI family transcriptional regulator
LTMTARPTMAEVARQARVSKMTVSRVINAQPGVSDKTRARVAKAIDRLGYVPSQRGRSLAVGRSNLLGIIVLDVTSEWVWSLVVGAGQAAEALGYQILLQTTGPGEVASFKPHRPALGGDLVDGLIIVSWRVPVAFALDLAQRHFPVALIDAYVRPDRVNWVSADDRAGARAATLHLAELGHRRIGFIGGGEEPYLAQQRLLGFRDGLAASGLGQDEVIIAHGDFNRESGYRLAQALLQERRRPTAIFAANDPMAMGAFDAARELGLSVPDDLSIIGFDDTPMATHVSPTLTTVARPYCDMGATAIQLLVDAVSAAPGESQSRQVDLATELIIRQSTAPPRSGIR